MNLNDVLYLRPTIPGGFGDERHPKQPARVIYINEAHGYFVAEFRGPGGQTFREGFPLPVDQRPDRTMPPIPDRSKRHGPTFGRKRPQ